MDTIPAKAIEGAAYDLPSEAAAKYPKNYLEKLVTHFKSETNPGAKSALASILQNIILAAEESASLCQDTGVPVFHVYLNPGVSIDGDIEAALTEAAARATEDVPIRKNVVEPFTFENPGTNTGWGAPFIYYHYDKRSGPLRLRTELKGFGGEIKSTVDWVYTSTESMEDAVLAYTLNNVMLSRGEGCMPGFLGIGVGGYASEAAMNAKNAIFRDLSDKKAASSADPFLRRLEERIYRCVNRLGLGPMGSGGDTTTMGVCLERRGTHTAASPVAVGQQCWASRAAEALITGEGVFRITPHVESGDLQGLKTLIAEEMSSRAGGTVHRLSTPVPPEQIRKLKAGDVVYVSGVLCTAREGAHRRMADVTVSFPVNLPEAQFSLAAMKDEGGNFVVDALSTDGGGIPRNTMVRRGLDMVKFGALTPSELARKLSVNAAGMLGLKNKGSLSPGADADITVIDPDAGRAYMGIALGRIVMVDGIVVGSGGTVLTTAKGEESVRGTGADYAVIDPSGALKNKKDR